MPSRGQQAVRAMPPPNAGCHTCKLRRIKCDGTKPICQRCMKSRRICVDANTAKQAGFSIHLENSYASGVIKRPRGPRSSLTLLRPHVDLQTRARAFYLGYHLQAPTDIPEVTQGLCSGISAWYSNPKFSESCPMVDLAFSSMALAVFSQIYNSPPAAREASARYHRLLRVAQKRIAQVRVSTLDDRDIDACLLTVFLMGRYEGTIYRPGNHNSKYSPPPSHAWSHHDGAMAILQLWSEFGHNPPTYIIKQSRRGLTKSCLLRGLPVPEWMLDGSRFGESDLELDYDRIFVRVVNLHYAAANLRGKNGICVAKGEQLVMEAYELDTASQDWAAQFPNRWAYQRHILAEPAPWPKKQFYSSTVYNCSEPGFASVWSQYFALRMLINSIRLSIVKLVRPNSLQWLESVAQLKTMGDSLASTIPSCLGRVKVAGSPDPSTSIILSNVETKRYLTYFAVWPLTIASTVEGIDAEQQQWFRSELAGLGRAIGDGALESAETDHWVTLGRTMGS